MRFPVFDLHSDVLLRVLDNGVDLLNPPEWPQATIPALRAGGVQEQVLALWVDSRSTTGTAATHRALRMHDAFCRQAEIHSAHIALARTSAEARSVVERGRIAIWLWLEGGALIADDLSLLRTFHRLGARGMTLTWTNNISWAGSSTDSADPARGLSSFGREVVRELDRLRMIVDVSHVSDRTFDDALGLAQGPVIASHSGCRALCSHPRNLTDDQLRGLRDCGGVIGIVALTEYLRGDWAAGWKAAEEACRSDVEAVLATFGGDRDHPGYREARRCLLQDHLAPAARVTLDTYLDHVEHAIAVAGPHHVALGSDFDGIWAFPVGMEKPSCWPRVAQRLLDRGESEATVRAIMAGNARRVFRQVIG